jgi:asparagine synthase (glutamine-hydrolysing)
MRTSFEISLSGEINPDFNISNLTNNLITCARDELTKNLVIFIGKIYYKDDLKTIYPQVFREKTNSEASIALAIYQQKGIQGLQDLEGEFALVIFDAQKHSLIVLRDPIGSYPLYWTSHDRTIRISTNLVHLARQTKATINRDFLASFLMFPFAFVELPKEQTAFEGITRLPPGTCMEFSLPNLVQKHWTWNWQEKIAPISNLTLEAAAGQFHQIFRQAIAERLGGEKVASHLSGGMDSSSIVCLARELIKEGKLLTLSLVYQMPSLVKETDYINLILQQNGAIEPYFLDGDSALDFDWFSDRIPAHDEPYPGLFHLAMEKILVDRAAELGVNTILSGGGAELVLESNRYHLADLLHQGQWQETLQLARQWAKVKNESLWSILAELAIFPLLPAPLHQGIPTLLRQGYGEWPKLGEFAIPPWIKADFAQEYQMYPKALATLRQIYRYPVESSFNFLGLQTAIGNWANWYLANPAGIRISQPFLDLRVICYCLGLPREFREVPGMVKPLLQSAMQGILPEAIRTRRFKANFNAVYWQGLSRRLTQLETMVQESAIEDLGIFDKTRLIEVLRQHSLGIGDVRSGSRISSSLAVIAWFDRLQQT